MSNLAEQLFTEYTKDPTGSIQTVVGVVELAKPLVYAVLMSLFDSYKDLTENKDYFDTVAQFYRNRFDALLNVGFTEDQALAIILKRDRDIEKAISSSNVSNNLKKN